MNRLTIKRRDKWIIPKRKLAEAAKKLAMFEDAEELEDVNEYCQAMWHLADAERGNSRIDYADAFDKAAAKIIQLSTFNATATGSMAERTEKIKQELLDFIDEIDGQIMDDPVSEIREKLEGLL